MQTDIMDQKIKHTNKDEKEIEVVFNSYYFKLIKRLQIPVGLWPYKTVFDKVFRRFVAFLLLLLTILPAFNGARIWCGKDIDVCCENITAIVYLTGVMCKFSGAAFSDKMYKFVYKRIAVNWLSITNPEEQAIMIKYAKAGRLKASFYAIYIGIAGIGFSQLPLVPIILDYIIPLNESRERIIQIKAEFIIDPFEHYYKLYFYYLVMTLNIVIIICSVDCTHTVVVHQVLGIFSVVIHRIQVATMFFNERPRFHFNQIVQAVNLHQAALQFVQLLNFLYSIPFVVLIGLMIVAFSIAAVVSLSLTNIYDVIRISLIIVGIVIHLLFLNWPGQLVIDHSNDLFTSTYVSDWYNISPQGKTLLRILMLKTFEPCVLTAGGVFKLNFENFGSIVKTTVSYVTVALSLRG